MVPFVGAGLSQPSGYPMWTPFLRNLRKRSRITEEQLDDLLSNGKYEEAAQALADDLGPIFGEELESTFGAARDITGAVQFLPSLFETPIITTNYDSVLKRVYENQNKQFEEIISGIQSSEISKFLGAGHRVLVKLHGTAMSGNGRILTLNEYNKHYVENDVIANVISAVCSKTLLFLGCGLSKDRTLGAMQSFAEQRGHENVARHYAFLQAPDGVDAMNERGRFLANSNIFPIWYSGGDHDQAIEAFLHKLNEY